MKLRAVIQTYLQKYFWLTLAVKLIFLFFVFQISPNELFASRSDFHETLYFSIYFSAVLIPFVDFPFVVMMTWPRKKTSSDPVGKTLVKGIILSAISLVATLVLATIVAFPRVFFPG